MTRLWQDPPRRGKRVLTEAMSRAGTDWAIVGAPFAAVRDMCIEGESGILKVAQRGEVIHCTGVSTGKVRLTWAVRPTC